MKKKSYEEFKKDFEKLSDEEKVQKWNEFCDENARYDDEIFPADWDELNEIFPVDSLDGPERIVNLYYPVVDQYINFTCKYVRYPEFGGCLLPVDLAEDIDTEELYKYEYQKDEE